MIRSLSLLDLLVFLGVWAAGCQSQVSIDDGLTCEGQDCFVISTPTATYSYQKEAGGFSNIMDRNGIDWVQFHKTDTAGFPHSAATDYRGLPNLVFRSEDGGCGHPGFDKMTSERISERQIRSISKSGRWEWVWSFYSDYAELEILKTDPEAEYWFLYEGPIAGRFSPQTHYWGTDLDGPLRSQPDLIKGPEIYQHWQTVYFGDLNYDQTFFVKQLEADTLSDLYTYMGTTTDGNSSEEGMVVFGFGRAPGATPLMTGNQKFVIGFYPGKIEDRKDHLGVLGYVHELLKKGP